MWISARMSHVTGDEKLLKYVRHNNVEEATSALVNGADPNFKGDHGNAALHCAVLVPSEVLVKLLIVFDADLTLKNNDHKTALELAEKQVDECVGNKDAARNVLDCIEEIVRLQKRLDDHDRDHPLQPSLLRPRTQEKENLMLSLDGGGIRGLVIVQVLLEMEKRRMKRYPDSDTLLSRFNWMTGTSSGGISALALAARDVKLKGGRALFFDMKTVFLGGLPPFPAEKVDETFKKTFHEDKMSEIEDTNVAVMTTLADRNPPILHIMSNYGNDRNGQLPPEEQSVWGAARATSAVPFFFHPQDGKFLDGGLMACNPTVDAVVDMLEHTKESRNPKLKMVLSLGCGLQKPVHVEDVDFEEQHSILARGFEKIPVHDEDCSQQAHEEQARLEEEARLAEQGHSHKRAEKLEKKAEKLDKKAEKLEKNAEIEKDLAVGIQMTSFLMHAQGRKSFANVMEIILSQIAMPDGTVCKRGEFLCKAIGAQYFRINPDLNENIEFNTTSDTELINMLYDVVHYMLENCAKKTDPVLDFIFG